MRIVLIILGVLAGYEMVAWLTRHRKRDMPDGQWWLQREWRKGDRGNW